MHLWLDFSLDNEFVCVTLSIKILFTHTSEMILNLSIMLVPRLMHFVIMIRLKSYRIDSTCSLRLLVVVCIILNSSLMLDLNHFDRL